MFGQRLYKICYLGLFFFSVLTMFIVSEIMFYEAGWMIFGCVGWFLGWCVDLVSGRNSEPLWISSFSTAGKICGLLFGISFWYLLRHTLFGFAKRA
jgi:hypothetical protein